MSANHLPVRPDVIDSDMELRMRLRGVVYVAESQAANLRELHGVQIDADEMIAVAELIRRELRAVLDAHPILPPERPAQGASA